MEQNLAKWSCKSHTESHEKKRQMGAIDEESSKKKRSSAKEENRYIPLQLYSSVSFQFLKHNNNEITRSRFSFKKQANSDGFWTLLSID